MNNKLFLILAVVSVLALSACEKPAFIQEYLGSGDEQDFTILPPNEAIDVNITDNATTSENMEIPKIEETPEEPQAPEEKEEQIPVKEEDVKKEKSTPEDTSKYVKKVVLEGDLVELSPRAVDPDGDKIEYTFSPPLDEKGTWQTARGDAGQYIVEVTASDGRLETTQKIMLVVESVNKAPVIEGLEDITVKEGDTVELNFEASDPDGDDLEVTISGWMDSKEYKTTYKDAGEHTVKVSADDGTEETTKAITVTVENVNRAPEFGDVKDIEAVEGDEIKLDPAITDLDDDEITLTYSEPFNEKGEWQTEEGDAGEYDVTITASDGDKEAKTKVKVTVAALNEPPVIEELEDITVDEGEKVVIEPVVSDPDGDELEITYSGWMTSSEYTTNYDDAGTYVVTVTASDGKASVSRDVNVIVNDVNRPPEFVLVG